MSAVSPQSFNRYSYVNNDPVNSVDPTGLMLSDIGVYQTNDPEEAQKAEHQALRDLQTSVNADYVANHSMPFPFIDTSDNHMDPAASPDQSNENTGEQSQGQVVGLSATGKDGDLFKRRASQNSDNSMSFGTGQELIADLEELSKQGPIAAVKVFDHGFSPGIIGGTQNNVGLYIESIHNPAYSTPYTFVDGSRHNIDVRGYIDQSTGEAKNRSSGAATARNLVDAIAKGSINIARNGRINLYGCFQDNLASHLATLLAANGRGDIYVSGGSGKVDVHKQRAPIIGTGRMNTYGNGNWISSTTRWRY